MRTKSIAKLTSFALAAALTAAGVGVLPTIARADQRASCTVTMVGYDPDAAWFQCQEDGVGATFFAWDSAAPGHCGNTVSLDTVKVWMSLVQAAFLSGKHLRVSFQSPAQSGCSTSGGAFPVFELVLIP